MDIISKMDTMDTSNGHNLHNLPHNMYPEKISDLQITSVDTPFFPHHNRSKVIKTM